MKLPPQEKLGISSDSRDVAVRCGTVVVGIVAENAQLPPVDVMLVGREVDRNPDVRGDVQATDIDINRKQDGIFYSSSLILLLF